MPIALADDYLTAKLIVPRIGSVKEYVRKENQYYLGYRKIFLPFEAWRDNARVQKAGRIQSLVELRNQGLLSMAAQLIRIGGFGAAKTVLSSKTAARRFGSLVDLF